MSSLLHCLVWCCSCLLCCDISESCWLCLYSLNSSQFLQIKDERRQVHPVWPIGFPCRIVHRYVLSIVTGAKFHRFRPLPHPAGRQHRQEGRLTLCLCPLADSFASRAAGCGQRGRRGENRRQNAHPVQEPDSPALRRAGNNTTTNHWLNLTCVLLLCAGQVVPERLLVSSPACLMLVFVFALIAHVVLLQSGPTAPTSRPRRSGRPHTSSWVRVACFFHPSVVVG